MATPIKYESGAKNLVSSINAATDTFKFALTNTPPVPTTHENLADITEISAGNGYVAGGLTVPVNLVEVSGAVSLNPSVTELVLTATADSISPFRYAVLYSDTAINKPLLVSIDYGSSITLNQNETLTLQLPSSLFSIPS